MKKQIAIILIALAVPIIFVFDLIGKIFNKQLEEILR